MGTWLFIPISFIVYVITFDKDFKEEDMGRALPFLVIVVVLSVVSSLLSIIGG